MCSLPSSLHFPWKYTGDIFKVRTWTPSSSPVHGESRPSTLAPFERDEEKHLFNSPLDFLPNPVPLRYCCPLHSWTYLTFQAVFFFQLILPDPFPPSLPKPLLPQHPPFLTCFHTYALPFPCLSKGKMYEVSLPEMAKCRQSRSPSCERQQEIP